MKLYTEEQVRKAIELARDTHPEGRGYVQREEYDYSIEDIVNLLTPMELPSYEEISKEATGLFGKTTAIYISIIQCKAFKQGAEWMRDKIEGGNNEQQ